MSDSILIQNAYVADPDSGYEGRADLLIEDGIIKKRAAEIRPEECGISPAGEDPSEDPADTGCAGRHIRVIDAEGLTLLPGFVDLHVHMRDPGQTAKEDLASCMEAAARGGITQFLAMPNTTPPVDSPEILTDILERSREISGVRARQSAAVSRGMQGRETVDFKALLAAGAAAFSEDGKSVMDSVLLSSALREMAKHDALFCDHCEDIGLVRGGVMNDDAYARKMGLPGITNAVEDTITARDIILAGDADARIHLCHASTRGAMRILKTAKAAGIRVTAEVCPHHFTLTSADIPSDDANYKMNPPLRDIEDRDALREALSSGLVDCISTDHAPHTIAEKSRGFLGSPFGIVGLETSAALTYTELVKTGVISLMRMAELTSRNPARILGMSGGSLREGMPADLVLFDFKTPYRIDPVGFRSKGRNTPFAGREVYGRTVMTLVGGRIIYKEAASEEAAP